MLDREEEYKKMAQVESNHWWYRTLHQLILNHLAKSFPGKDIAILDAGCGTGGLMLYLADNGYHNLRGFDLSSDAVRICHANKLNVKQADLRDLKKVFSGQCFDVIISNDTLYFLDSREIQRFLNASHEQLNSGGVLICNLPALPAFRGIHDLAVGIQQRFTMDDINELLKTAELELVHRFYWPLLLSPVIFLVRLLQRIKLRLKPDNIIRSDIDIPHPIVNRLLEKVCEWDVAHLRHRPFGSSLFIVLRKID